MQTIGRVLTLVHGKPNAHSTRIEDLCAEAYRVVGTPWPRKSAVLRERVVKDPPRQICFADVLYDFDSIRVRV